MKRAITTLGVLGLAAFAVAAPAVADRGGDGEDSIVICHAGASSNSGKFTAITVAVPSLNGHGLHSEDIIPSIAGIFDGQNWDDVGKAIHAAGCVAPGPVVPPVDVPVANPPVVNPPVVGTPVVNPPVVSTPVVNPPVVNPPVVNQPVVPPVVVVPPVESPVTSGTVPPAATPVVVQEQPAAVQPQVKARQAAAGAPATGAPATTSVGTNQGYNAQTAVGGVDSPPAWLAGLGALFAAGAAVALRRGSRTSPLAS